MKRLNTQLIRLLYQLPKLGYDVPTGIVTLSEVDVALFTVAFTAPKYTTSFAAFVLKFVPVMVAVVPMEPEVGEKEVIVGGPNGVALTSLEYPLSNLALSIAVTLK